MNAGIRNVYLHSWFDLNLVKSWSLSLVNLEVYGANHDQGEKANEAEGSPEVPRPASTTI